MLKRIHAWAFWLDTQKQPSRGVLRKRCFENMQQIYRITPISKCDLQLCFETLLKLSFGMGVLLQIFCIFLKQLFVRTPLEGCFLVRNYINLFNRYQNVKKDTQKRKRKLKPQNYLFAFNMIYYLYFIMTLFLF